MYITVVTRSRIVKCVVSMFNKYWVWDQRVHPFNLYYYQLSVVQFWVRHGGYIHSYDLFLRQTLTRAAIFAQGRASRCVFHALAICATAFGATTAQHFSAHFACFWEVTPHNVSLPSISAHPAPSCWPWKLDLWSDCLAPAMPSRICCSPRTLKKRTLCRWNFVLVSAFPRK